MHTDFYIYIASGTMGDEALHLVASMRQTGENSLKSWITRSGIKGSATVQSYRYAINADTSTPNISFFVTELTPSPALTAAEFEAHASASATTVSNGTVPSTTNTNSGGAASGCASSWNTRAAEVTSSDLCSGLALDPAPPPFWATSATAYMSMKDVYENTSKVTDL